MPGPDTREAVNRDEFYDLRRKLWVETLAHVMARPWGPSEFITAQSAASFADQAVVEFHKRFRCV